MSIASEITRLQGVKSDILTAIAAKGVTVPAGSALDDCPGLIASIGFDIIGNRKYKTVKMPDGKTWLAENLDYKFDGCGIGGAGNPTTPNAWYYNNDELDYGIDGTYKCGLLYNGYAAEYLDNNKASLLPSGWRLPTKADFDALIEYIGGTAVAGTKLKAINYTVTPTWPAGWNGTDDYEFKTLPAGRRYGDFGSLGTQANYWCFRANTNPDEMYRIVIEPTAAINKYHDYSIHAFSIRLVRD